MLVYGRKYCQNGIFVLGELYEVWPEKNKPGFPEAADVTACLFRKPDLGTNSKIRKDGGFCLHAPASICALVFIDGEAGELGDIAHFLQALARMEHYLWLAEHGCREFFGCG